MAKLSEEVKITLTSEAKLLRQIGNRELKQAERQRDSDGCYHIMLNTFKILQKRDE